MDGERLGRAVELAARLHADQKRKGTEIPYVAHLLAVAALVLEQEGGGEDDAVAAVLHDAVEDAGGEETLALIERDFGAGVARIVRAVSDRMGVDHRSWRQRKEDYIRHLRTAGEMKQLGLLDADLPPGFSIPDPSRPDAEAEDPLEPGEDPEFHRDFLEEDR